MTFKSKSYLRIICILLRIPSKEVIFFNFQPGSYFYFLCFLPLSFPLKEWFEIFLVSSG